MESIDKILDTLEQEVNEGIEVTKRIQEKTFGLFKNPVFLLTFFTFLFITIGYKIYHFYKREDDSKCYNYKSNDDCPKYCIWDTEEDSCLPKLKAGNACPDYWVTSVDGDTITCSPEKNLVINKSCFTTDKKTKKQSTVLEIKKGKIQNDKYSDKCSWIKNCGAWEGQSIGKFGCESDTSLNQKATNWP